VNKKIYVTGCLAALVLTLSMCRKPSQAALQDDANFDPRLSGGAATTFDISSQSFSAPTPGLGIFDAYVHALGDKLFGQPFISAPAPLFGGLGPVYNNTSCISCHHNDGIGIPTAGQTNSSLLIRLCLPGTDAHGGPVPVPGFGLQLQDVGLFGVAAEGRVNISYTEVPFTYPDGKMASLRKPLYTVTETYIPLPGGCMMSPRMAPPIFGLGLLENIADATIIGFADPADKNGDGIKGRPNYVYDPYTKQTVLGRFGLKANTSTLLLQVATAFQQDMGITSYVQPQKSTWGQLQMSSVHDSGKLEVTDSQVNAVKFYIQSLAVPARRNVTDAKNLRGEALFVQINCGGCHIPTMYTGVNVAMPAMSHQRIHAYTDLLLHDMGASLADNRPDYLATGNDWRTSPLWGVGLLKQTNGTPYYLHDGRARTIEEAILCHGGEAQASKNAFVQLSISDRDAVVAFLQSL
jgi:CxxC motif-containing protein (DUF1111 family)